MHKTLMIIALCAAFPVAAEADPVTVSFSTAGAGPFSFQADTFSLNGQVGLIALDTASSTTANINTAVFFTGNSGSFNGTETLVLTYALTLDGITHDLTQMATWWVTPPRDSFITMSASSPVLFDTPSGTWNVRLGAYSLSAVTLDIGVTQNVQTPADFEVPEPDAMELLTPGLLLVGLLLLKKRNCWVQLAS